MDFYREKLMPILKKTAKVIEETEHMQDIINGTMPDEVFRFQIQQNYQYLMDYTRCWAVALSKCTSYEEMEVFYNIVKNTMENSVMYNRTFWAEQTNMTTEEMDAIIEAPGKRSYTAFQLMVAHEGQLAECMMAMFPCNIIYRYFGEDLLDKCKLDKDNKFYKWIEAYSHEDYIQKTENEIALVNRFCAHKTEKEQARLIEILCDSCNYEILQWRDMYHKMETWPLDDIYPKKHTTYKD